MQDTGIQGGVVRPPQSTVVSFLTAAVLLGMLWSLHSILTGVILSPVDICNKEGVKSVHMAAHEMF